MDFIALLIMSISFSTFSWKSKFIYIYSLIFFLLFLLIHPFSDLILICLAIYLSLYLHPLPSEQAVYKHSAYYDLSYDQYRELPQVSHLYVQVLLVLDRAAVWFVWGSIVLVAEIEQAFGVAAAGLPLTQVDHLLLMIFSADVAHATGVVKEAHVRVELRDTVFAVWVLYAFIRRLGQGKDWSWGFVWWGRWPKREERELFDV